MTHPSSLSLLVFPEYAVEKPHVVVDCVFADRLPAAGHVVHMIRPSSSARDVEIRPAPWTTGTLICFPDEPLKSAVANIGRTIRRSRWLMRALDRVPAVPLHAVLVRNDLLAALLAMRLTRRAGIPLIFQISSPDGEFRIHAREPRGIAGVYSRLRGRMDRQLRRYVCRRAAAVLAISAEMRRYLIETDGLLAEKVFSFPMGTGSQPAASLEGGSPTRSNLGLPDGSLIVYSGVIDPVRSPTIMLDVLARVRESVPDAVLLVLTYQQDDRRAAFERAAKQRGLPVIVRGPLHHSEVAPYLSVADVMLSPYAPRLEHSMCSPTKSVEALGAGLAVVGNREVVEHVRLLGEAGGGLAVPYDADDLARAVVFLLQHPEERRRMGESGRTWVTTRRSYERLTRYLESILVATVEKRSLAALVHDPDLAPLDDSAFP